MRLLPWSHLVSFCVASRSRGKVRGKQHDAWTHASTRQPPCAALRVPGGLLKTWWTLTGSSLQPVCVFQRRHPVVSDFRCGKLTRDGNKLTCVWNTSARRACAADLLRSSDRPDTRKGVLRVVQGLDELTHLVWATRDGADEEDIIIFPAEAKFHKARPPSSRCKTTAHLMTPICTPPQLPQPRCYALKFEGQSDRNMYFWMQEPKAEDDGRLTDAANIALGNAPPAAPIAPSPAHGLGMLSPVAPTPVATTSAPPSTAPPAPAKSASQAPVAEASTPAPGGRPTLGDLQRILSTMGMPQATPGGASTPGITPQQAAAALAQAMMSIGGGGDAAMEAEAQGPLLSDVLTPDVLLSALVSPEVQQRLAPYLPEEQRTHDALRDLVRSPQFSSQLRAFSRALQTGAIDVRQFGLTHGGTALNVADFLAAIQSAAQAEAEEQGKGGGDADMADDPPAP